MTYRDFIPVAEVVKAVGLRGEVKLYPLLNWFEPLLDSEFLQWEDGEPFLVERYRPSGSCTAVLLDGVLDRDGADRLVGRMVGFLRSRYPDPAFPRPAGGLPFRWLGRTIRTVGGERVGEVDEIRRAGISYLLVVRRDGAEILIPAVPPILLPEDALEGELVIDPPEGLLDVAFD